MSPKSLKRRPASITPPVKFTIFSEGKNTEPEYFGELDKATPNALVRIKTFPAAGVPTTIASKAIKFSKQQRTRKLSSFEERDQIWAVFDRDEHDKVKESIDNLKAKKIGVAYTNPCFEVWLILHYEDFDRPLDRHAVQKHLEELCDGYKADGGKKPDCKAIMPNVEKAEARAKKMNARREREGAVMSPPWTTVFELTEAICKAAKG